MVEAEIDASVLGHFIDVLDYWEPQIDPFYFLSHKILDAMFIWHKH